MSFYTEYLAEIEERKTLGLSPKPIEDGALVTELIAQISDTGNEHREQSLQFFIYNTLPGTTSAAVVKAKFLKEIILGSAVVKEISASFALELLSHMKGGPSVEVLLDLALSDDASVARSAADVLKTQFFLYDADMARLEKAFKSGNEIAKDILESYAKAEFFTKLPDIDDEIKVVTYVAAEGDISTDLMSPGNQAHSRADRELHGKCFISEAAQAEIRALQQQHPDKQVMLIAEKGHHGRRLFAHVGHQQRGVVDGQTGQPLRAVRQLSRRSSPGPTGSRRSFSTTVGVTGGIGTRSEELGQETGSDGKVIFNNDGSPVLEEIYSVARDRPDDRTQSTKDSAVEDGKGRTCRRFGTFSPAEGRVHEEPAAPMPSSSARRLQTFSRPNLGREAKPASPRQGGFPRGPGPDGGRENLQQQCRGTIEGTVLHAGPTPGSKVNIVGSQDTTGPMTVQELEAMAATVHLPDRGWRLPVRLSHGVGVGQKAQANSPSS